MNKKPVKKPTNKAEAARKKAEKRRKDALAYGSHHRQQREALLYRHRDGTECEYCGEPMFKRAEDNFDLASLEAD